MSNSTSNASTPGCELGYSNLIENLKYASQTAYLVPTSILYGRILYVIWIKCRKTYGSHQFFVIYSMDCVVGLLLLLLDIFITRLFVYIPQLCQSASQFFLSHPLFMDFYYPLLNYLHCAQPLIQIFLTLNRSSSVLWPIDHNKIWRERLPFIIYFVLLTPFLFIWNTIISPKVLIYLFGGFYINYEKLVPWAGMSKFFLTIRSVAVIITVISTIITFWRMTKMKKRMKKSERTLCWACAANSICFILPAVFEAQLALNTAWSKSSFAYIIQPFTWDILNIGSPIVMILASGQLRGHVFSLGKKPKISQLPSINNQSTVASVVEIVN